MIVGLLRTSETSTIWCDDNLERKLNQPAGWNTKVAPLQKPQPRYPERLENSLVLGLDNPPPPLKLVSHIDVVISPLSTPFLDSNEVLAVMTGVLKPSCPAKKVDLFKKVFTCFLQHVHLVESMQAKLARLDAEKVKVSEYIKSKTAEKKQEIKIEIVDVKNQHKAPELERIDMLILNRREREIDAEARQLISRTSSVKENAELDALLKDVDEW